MSWRNTLLYLFQNYLLLQSLIYCDTPIYLSIISPNLGFTHIETYVKRHCIKYVRIRVFNDQCTPLEGQNRKFCSFTREYGSVTRIHAFTHILCNLDPHSRIFYVVLPDLSIFSKPHFLSCETSKSIFDKFPYWIQQNARSTL